MKHRALYLYLLLGSILASCQSKDIESYDAQSSYIYFDLPFKTDSYGRQTTERADSISYSFALDDISIQDTIVEVVVKTIGLPVDYDRPYKVQLVEVSSTVTDADWDESSIQNRVISAGNITDTIQVKIHRGATLKQHWLQVLLRLMPNDSFSIGYTNLQEAKISFSDILAQPSWWKKWQSVFGDFVREKYVKWIEIYYLGADPNTSYDNGQPLYWNNMPTSPMPSWYPVLFMNVRILKQYFIDNEVYPDGDTSRPRITIPY